MGLRKCSVSKLNLPKVFSAKNSSPLPNSYYKDVKYKDEATILFSLTLRHRGSLFFLLGSHREERARNLCLAGYNSLLHIVIPIFFISFLIHIHHMKLFAISCSCWIAERPGGGLIQWAHSSGQYLLPIQLPTRGNVSVSVPAPGSRTASEKISFIYWIQL